MRSGAPSITNLRGHETVVLFPSLGHLEPDGATWRLQIEGEVFSPGQMGLTKRILLKLLQRAMKVPRQALESDIFRERIERFLAADERGKRIALQLGHATFVLPRKSAGNGHFSGVIRLAADYLGGLRELGCLEEDRLHLEVHDPRGEVASHGTVHLIPREGLSIISDIDDTIKHSDVASRHALLMNTFLHEFQPIPGMVEQFQAWARAGAAFHYVSSSPWQLYRHLSAHLTEVGFPEGTYHLRAFRLRDDVLRRILLLRRSGKGNVIKSILRAFPQRQFILVGDSGEADPEIYGALARKFPQQVSRVLIRELDIPRNNARRFGKAFRGLGLDVAVTFREAEELAAAVPQMT
jgi:phosphatidate phosphatase APP1